MPTTEFDRAVQKTHIWLKDLMRELEWDDRDLAFLALRAVLQVLRDRMTCAEVADLGAQLPVILRGAFYEGWDPSVNPVKERRLKEFLGRVARALPTSEPLDPEKMTRAVFKLLDSRIAQGEIGDIRHILPKELNVLWPAKTVAETDVGPGPVPLAPLG